ncbi:hypothetical protein [Sphingobacterium sp. SYP-B4668]|uniref:hypothetical protein n=1 Tax=Sphingobacterium sp. SYP-B4668 TaxID=2996035 RepID=UPI0022DE5F53|nr:hypothetical protein [Sphingobacterium sp. SYP-B4668]
MDIKHMKIALTTILGLIALWMIYLGVKADLLPPVLTGLGFLVIGALLMLRAKK